MRSAATGLARLGDPEPPAGAPPTRRSVAMQAREGAIKIDCQRTALVARRGSGRTGDRRCFCPQAVTRRAGSGAYITAPSRAEQARRGSHVARVVGRQHQRGVALPTVASMGCRADRPLAQAPPCSSEQAPPSLWAPLLLRLAEQHCDRCGVSVEVHRLADRRVDAAVRRARRDRWLSSAAAVS